MSHLPPRPDYSYPPPPSRYDSRHPPPPIRPPPDHAYPRDREPPYGRSPPPRSRYPSDRERLTDSYVAPPDPYISRESYPPGPPSRYDREGRDREEERYRRERDYPPPRGPPSEYRDRPRNEPRGDPRAPPPYYGRPRREPDSRSWARRDDYERRDERRRDVYNSERDRDRGRERPYPPRRSASPPRTYSSYPPRRGEPSTSNRPRSPPPPRRRTPSPRHRTRSPGEYSRSPRSASPTKPNRLAPASIPTPGSPRYRPRDDDRYESRRGPVRRVSRSRIRSPMRSPRRQTYSRSRSPVHPRGRSRSKSLDARKQSENRVPSPMPSKPSESIPLKDKEPEKSLTKQPEQPPVAGDTQLASVKPVVIAAAAEEQKLQVKPDKDVDMKAEAITDTKVDVKPQESTPPAPSEPEQDPLWKVEDTKQLDKDGIPLIEKRGILLPESYWQNVSGKTPLTKAESTQKELQVQEEIQKDPSWRALQDLATQFAPLSTNAFVGPPLKDIPEYVKDMADLKGEDEDLKDLGIPAYESWYSHPDYEIKYFLKQVNGKIDPLLQRRAHLESERLKLWRETNQALLDLEIAALDVKGAERRRQIASEQLDLAMEGRLGMDYDHSNPSISDRLDATGAVLT